MTSRRERKTCFWHLLVSEKCQLLAWPHSSCWGSSSTEWYVSQFFKKSTVSQFLMNNFIVPENLHLQTFIMVIREGKKIFVCISLCLSIIFLYTYVCACIFAYMNMQALFNHFYCLLHNQLSLCDNVCLSGICYIPCDWYTSGVPFWAVTSPQKSQMYMHCMQADQWKVVNTCKPVSKTVFLKTCAYNKCFFRLVFMAFVVPQCQPSTSMLLETSENQVYFALIFFSIPCLYQAFPCFLHCCSLGVRESVKLETSVHMGAGC